MSEEFDESGDDDPVSAIRVDSPNGEMVYLDSSDCEVCGDDAEGVVVKEHPSGETLSRCVCGGCLEDVGSKDGEEDFEFKGF